MAGLTGGSPTCAPPSAPLYLPGGCGDKGHVATRTPGRVSPRGAGPGESSSRPASTRTGRVAAFAPLCIRACAPLPLRLAAQTTGLGLKVGPRHHDGLLPRNRPGVTPGVTGLRVTGSSADPALPGAPPWESGGEPGAHRGRARSPVLRSLARLKPTMTLEEGLQRAEQEWERMSNFDRMMYYEMAAKFKEFEAEEEIQLQQLQCMKWVQCLPPPAPPESEPQGPPDPKVGLQQGTHVPTGAGRKASVPRKAGPRAKPAHPQPHRSQRPRETKAPKEIPLEAVKEYEDILEELLGPVHSATGETDAECPEDGTHPDPGLLSYMDQLCSQGDFVTKVEAVIHPQFLAHLLSPEPQLDPLALAEELEQEEGLSPEEDMRVSLHPGLDSPSLLPRVKGTLHRVWDPGTPQISERPLLLGRMQDQGQRMGPVRPRRRPPAWILSWLLSTA
ncbi:NUT family member 2-like [Vicugna pacos]|uniref:NUT family member 2-like n=1 Tax=Vicugna pacos TaxID=30538 RepID=A0ABM5CG93_VICPA